MCGWRGAHITGKPFWRDGRARGARRCLRSCAHRGCWEGRWAGSQGCGVSSAHQEGPGRAHARSVAQVYVGGWLPTLDEFLSPTLQTSPPLPPGILEPSSGGRDHSSNHLASPSWTKGGLSGVCPGRNGLCPQNSSLQRWDFCSLSCLAVGSVVTVITCRPRMEGPGEGRGEWWTKIRALLPGRRG